LRGLGYLPDPADGRDMRPIDLLGVLASSSPPTSASVRHPLVQPRDQGATNSCTGQAWSQALRLAWLRAGKSCPELSALDNYWKGRQQWGAHLVDEGSHLRTGARAVMKFGCATEKRWPFDAAKVNLKPSWWANRSGHDSRGVRGYYKLYWADDVRRAIATGHPVVGGWKVGQPFLEYNGTGVIDEARGPTIGGHAVVIEEYFADGTFGFLNSWGYGWGIGGRGLATERWVDSGRDKWAVVVTP
jgi:hypothetical protein